MNYIENIKRIRNDKRVSQTDMAEKLGIAQNNYGRIERGLTELTVDRIYKIAEILEVSVLDILGEVSKSLDSSENEVLRKENEKLKEDYNTLQNEHKEWREDTIKLMDKYEILNLVYVQSKNEVSAILNSVENLLNDLYSNTALEMGYDFDSEVNFKMISKEIFRANSLLCIVLFDTLNIVKSSKWIVAWVREKALYEVPKINDIIKLMKQYNESDEDSFIRILKQVDKQRGYKFTDDEIEDALEKYRHYKGFFSPQYLEN